MQILVKYSVTGYVWGSATRMYFRTSEGDRIHISDGIAFVEAAHDGNNYTVCAGLTSCSSFNAAGVNVTQKTTEANDALALTQSRRRLSLDLPFETGTIDRRPLRAGTPKMSPGRQLSHGDDFTYCSDWTAGAALNSVVETMMTNVNSELALADSGNTGVGVAAGDLFGSAVTSFATSLPGQGASPFDSCTCDQSSASGSTSITLGSATVDATLKMKMHANQCLYYGNPFQSSW